MRQATATQKANDVSATLEELKAQQSQPQTNGTTVRDFAVQPLTSHNASIDMESIAPAQTQDPAIAAQIEAVRKELEHRHEERIRAAEARYAEVFQRRSENMKVQLNQKLKDKEAVRAALVTSHNEELERLAMEHQQQIQALKTRHQDEVEELKRNEASRFEEYKKHIAQTQPTAATNGDAEPKVEASGPAIKPIWELSEAEIKDFIAKSDTAKTIIRNNIRPVVAREKENLANQLKEEHQKMLQSSQEEHEKALQSALEDAQAKASNAKEQAVLMEGKRFGVKMNMTENRARIATAKLDYVSKAAQETPQKPVVEVWEVAKTVKPAAPPSTAQAAQLQEPAAPVEAQPFTATQAPTVTPATLVTTTAPEEQPLQSSVFAQPTLQSSIPTGPSASALPIPFAKNSQTPLTNPFAASSPPNNAMPKANPVNHAQTPPQSQATTRLPNQPLQNSGIPRSTSFGNMSRAQSNLPMPSGTSIRGRGNQGALGQSQHAPGRGGRGRGGFVQPPPTTLGLDHEGRGGSPTGRGQGLNAGARQFVPGGKRGRDDEDIGGDGATGKRANRGGGPPNRGGGAVGN